MVALGRGGLSALGAGFALGAGALVGAGSAGCGALSGLRAEERRLLFSQAQLSSPLPVVKWSLLRPDGRSVLRQKAMPARSMSGKSLRRLDEKMRETLAATGGVGLAAPQVGLARRVILVQLQGEKKPVLTCVDPVILRRADKTEDGYEACLSVDGVGGLVRRAQWVEVSYLDLEGRRRRLLSRGWEARIFQHEVDHLDGVLYLDRLSGPLLPIDEVRRLRRLRKALAPAGTSAPRAATWPPYPGADWLGERGALFSVGEGRPERPAGMELLWL